jgi:hypothetical protein
MSPAEDALLLLRVVQRHLGSLRGTVNNPDFADEDWGFLAQQCVEKLLKALLVLQDMEPPRIHALDQLHRITREAGIKVRVPVVLLKLEDFAVLARYEADPTPLPASREVLQVLLDQLHQDVCARVGI